MEYRKMRLSESDKLNAKARNKSHIESMTHKLLLYYSDPDKKIRTKEKHECRYCYYVASRIGGSAITTVICANCDNGLLNNLFDDENVRNGFGNLWHSVINMQRQKV